MKRTWADYDPHAAPRQRLQVYDTRADQRGNRPDLKPIPVVIVRLDNYAALEDLVAETIANREGYTVIGEPAMIYRGHACAVLAALRMGRPKGPPMSHAAKSSRSPLRVPGVGSVALVRARRRKRAVVVMQQPRERWDDSTRLYMVAHFDGNLRYVGGAFNVKSLDEANRIARENRRVIRKMGDLVVARLNLPNGPDEGRREKQSL